MYPVSRAATPPQSIREEAPNPAPYLPSYSTSGPGAAPAHEDVHFTSQPAPTPGDDTLVEIPGTTLPNPSDEKLDLPCCTYQVFCKGCYVSWRDMTMVAVEGTTVAVAAIAFAVTKKYWLGGMGAGVVLAELVVHALWHRDGDLADLRRTVDKLERTDHKLDNTVKKTDEVADKLKADDDQLKKERMALQETNTALAVMQANLRQQVDTYQKQNVQYAADNKDLGAVNQQMKAQINQLQGIISVLNDQLAKFNQLNGGLAQNIGNLGKTVVALQKQDAAIKFDMSKMDQSLGSEIASLAKEVSTTQKMGTDLLTLFGQEIDNLKGQVQAFQATEKKLNQDAQTIVDRTGLLFTLEKKIQDASDALEERKKAFEKINAALDATKGQLGKTLQMLQAADSKLSHDNTDLKVVTESLGTLSGHLDQMSAKLLADMKAVQSIDNASAALEKEIAKS
jgi:chromosome segregation ATPase